MNVCYDKLWKMLIDKKLNKTQLRQKAGISSNSLAKLGKNKPVNLDILLRICETLDSNIEDVVEFIK